MFYRILTILLLFALNCAFVNCLNGKSVSDDVVGYLGIPYAAAPLREMRLKNSILSSTFDESKDYTQWPDRCVKYSIEEGVSEDCLYLSIFRKKDREEPTPVLLYLTNDQLSETKLKQIVTSELTVVVAHVREGAFASFDEHIYSTSDIENVFKFLSNEKERFHFGDITVIAEGHLAEAVSLVVNDIGAKRAILFNGNAFTRTNGRERFPRKTAYRLLKQTECDLPSEEQAIKCLRAMNVEQFVETTKKVKESFYPFGDPFRLPTKRRVTDRQIPTLYGLYKQTSEDYPVTSNFTEDYTYTTFKQFLAGVIPDADNRNGPLIRRMALHHYVHTKGDKNNFYFLFETMPKILHARDFAVPTEKLVMHLAKKKKNSIWLFEYGIDNPPTNCLQDGGWDDIEPFCHRLIGYYTRFASKGAPAQEGCDRENPGFPALRTSKRDYFIRLHADGKPEWDFNFHQEDCAFWNDLLPSLNKLELAGRRDAVFPEEQEKSPLEEEDDVQMWHANAKTDDTELTEEKALNDMPYKAEL